MTHALPMFRSVRSCSSATWTVPKWPEPVRAKVGVGAPEVVACEVDVLPAERGEMGEQFVRHQVTTQSFTSTSTS
jgi:hypothetical protein